jgi:hypothetical protein
MKSIASLTKSLLACGVALTMIAMATDAPAQGMKTSKAKVRAVRGEVQFKASKADDWVALKQGMVLTPGAVVETGKGAQVDLFLDRVGSVVRLTESSRMGIDDMGPKTIKSPPPVQAQKDSPVNLATLDTASLLRGGRIPILPPVVKVP